MDKDVVNHPSHYTQGKQELIDVMEDLFTDEQFKGYLMCNVIKYIVRHEYKNGTEDLEKGRWYLNRLIEIESKNENENEITRQTFEELMYKLP